MQRRALGAAFLAALISALTGSVALADNPHGTPPGQAAQDQTTASVTVSASASAENKGQAKKAEESSQASSSANASASGSPSADSQTKQTPGGDKFDGCTGTPNTSGSPGVKSGSDTDKWTCATAGATPDQTKRYGNGSTAGQGVVARGGAGHTLRGPGNSQPHMVQPCPGSRHWRDWHAVKNYNPASCSSSPGTSSSCSLQPGQVRVNGQCVWPCPNNQAMPASGHCGSSSSTTTVTTSTSVTNNSTTNNSVTNNSTTNNSTTNNSITNNSTTNNSTTSNSPTSNTTSPATSTGVKGAQHSSSPKTTAGATAPASSSSPAASTAPASTKGVLGTSATPSSGSLPFTGLPLWLPALLALGLAAGGFSLLRFGRSRA